MSSKNCSEVLNPQPKNALENVGVVASCPIAPSFSLFRQRALPIKPAPTCAAYRACVGASSSLLLANSHARHILLRNRVQSMLTRNRRDRRSRRQRLFHNPLTFAEARNSPRPAKGILRRHPLSISSSGGQLTQGWPLLDLSTRRRTEALAASSRPSPRGQNVAKFANCALDALDPSLGFTSFTGPH